MFIENNIYIKKISIVFRIYMDFILVVYKIEIRNEQSYIFTPYFGR